MATTTWSGEDAVDLLETGLRLIEMGLPIIPVGKDKDPKGVIRWRKGKKDYVSDRMTAQEWEEWADNPKVHGIAVLGSEVYGTFILDVETPGVANPAIQKVLDEDLPQTCQQRTLKGGQHAYLMGMKGDEHPGGSQKLAKDPPPEGGSDRDAVLLAEIRGHAGYAVIVGPGRPPLPADFAPYVISREEWDVLEEKVRAAGSWHKEPPELKEYNRTGAGGGTGGIVTDAVAQHALSPLAVLPVGWEIAGCSSWDERTYVVRPGADSETSGNVLGAVVVIWSSAVEWAVPGKGYSAAETLARARFDGDYAAAMQWVEARAVALCRDGEAPPPLWPVEVLEEVYDSVYGQVEATINQLSAFPPKPWGVRAIRAWVARIESSEDPAQERLNAQADAVRLARKKAVPLRWALETIGGASAWTGKTA